MLEQDVQTEILDWLNSNGIFAFRVNTTGIYDARTGVYRRPGKFFMKGCSDIVGLMPNGRFLAIECKAIKGRLSPEQATFIDKIKRQGGFAMVARSLEDVKGALYGLDDNGRKREAELASGEA